MKIRKLLLKTFIFTALCFLFSYATSWFGKHDSENYPSSILAAFAEKSNASLSDVHLKQVINHFKSTKIVVKTTSTDVSLEVGSGQDLEVSLDGKFMVSTNPNEPVLSIHDAQDEFQVEVNEAPQSGEHINLNFGSTVKDGKLKIILPSGFKDVVIKTVSGETAVVAKSLNELVLKSVSGDAKAQVGHVETFERKAVSGESKFVGAVEHASAKSVSGDVNLEINNASPALEIETTSGHAKVYFTKKPDVSLNYKSLSGESKVDPKFGQTANGKGRVDVKTVSGDLELGTK